jgi:hypothetical protein
MATKRRRDPRHSRTIGRKPFVGRRYVENGKVRIEWSDHGRRRRRTIGKNSAETRRQADADLEEILARMQNNEEHHEPGGQEEQENVRPLSRTLRHYAVAALDVADRMADWVRASIGRMPEWEVVEEEDAAGEAGEDEIPTQPHQTP